MVSALPHLWSETQRDLLQEAHPSFREPRRTKWPSEEFYTVTKRVCVTFAIKNKSVSFVCCRCLMCFYVFIFPFGGGGVI